MNLLGVGSIVGRWPLRSERPRGVRRTVGPRSDLLGAAAEIDDAEPGQRLEARCGAWSRARRARRPRRAPPSVGGPLDAGDALIRCEVALERVPRDPAAFAEIGEGVDHHLPERADGARVAALLRHAKHLALGARLVPRAAAAPRGKEHLRQLVHRERPRRRRRRGRRRIPEPDRARQRREQRHRRDVAAVALRELHQERARGAYTGAHLVPGLAHAERHRDGEVRRIGREARAAGRVIFFEHERADLLAPRLACGGARRRRSAPPRWGSRGGSGGWG